MKWSDVQLNPELRVLRQFAAACFVFFLAMGAWQYFGKGRTQLGLALAALALVLGLPGWFRPGFLRWIFVGWMVLAFPIGWVVSMLMLLIMYFLVLTPVAFFFRITSRDLLARKPQPDGSSFWAPKETPQDVRTYFRQY